MGQPFDLIFSAACAVAVVVLAFVARWSLESQERRWRLEQMDQRRLLPPPPDPPSELHHVGGYRAAPRLVSPAPRSRWSRARCALGLHDGPVKLDYHTARCEACNRCWIT